MEKRGQSTWKNVPQVMRVEQGSELTFWTALYGMVSWWVTSPRDENRALEQLGSYPVIHFCFRRVYFYTYCLLYRGVLGMNTGSALPATRNRWLTLNRRGGGPLRAIGISFFLTGGGQWMHHRREMDFERSHEQTLGRTPCCQKKKIYRNFCCKGIGLLVLNQVQQRMLN